MKTQMDRDGQPLNAGFNEHRRLERDISEMLGLAKGILGDGKVEDAEIQMIRAWMRSHPDVQFTWPGDILAKRLERVFADKVISPEERDDLQQLLSELIGGKASIIGSENLATTLPLDKPAPKIIFSSRTFVLTGKFAFGPRSQCEKFTQAAGGLCDRTISRRTNYLVIGTFGSRDWVHTSHGRKIEKAVDYKKYGQDLFIVGEDHWANSLPPGG